MLKKFLLLALAAVLATSGVACGKKQPPPLKPGELSPAERDKLKVNVINHYEKIVKDYPDSPHAEDAKKRLQALKPAGGK